ncbi:hypothetical protein VTO42DRAFT_7749 [Malbranchea cinnamomea]
MFTSSMRRVARPPAGTLPTSTTRPSSAVIASATPGFVTTRTQQRRYSSSKPPVPPSDGSRGIDASSQTPAKGVSPSNAEKRDGKSSRRRGKDNGKNSKNDTFLNLPSVPSTQHLHPLDVHVASFFSIHRPMSITTSIPPNSTPEAFNAIFEPKNQAKNRQQDVISTLSSAINAIESGFSKKTQRGSAGEKDLRAAITQASTSNAEPNLDGMSAEELRAAIQDFAKNLQPFNPPPAPVPMQDAEASSAIEAEDAESETLAPRQRSYSTVLTIRESSHSDGSKSYEAFTTPFVQVEDFEAPSGAEEGKVIKEGESTQLPLTFLEQMPSHQSIRRRRLRDRMMYAISVKRQRRLKMKKHKRKKWLRKTRTLRRKLDKA